MQFLQLHTTTFPQVTTTDNCSPARCNSTFSTGIFLAYLKQSYSAADMRIQIKYFQKQYYSNWPKKKPRRKKLHRHTLGACDYMEVSCDLNPVSQQLFLPLVCFNILCCSVCFPPSVNPLELLSEEEICLYISPTTHDSL